ncbi:aspartic proteinase-like protein 2 [Tanacetum coccineum]
MASGFPTTLRLERGFPVDNVVELNELKFRDSLRHPRILQQQQQQSSVASVVDFPVQGTYDPYRIPIQFYDPSSSSTASMISCSDQRCALGTQSSDSGCSGSNNQCSYTFQYGDGSGTSGFYVSDQIHLDTIVGDSSSSNASASIVFGCSTTQTGDLTKPDRAVDGIFGFGQQGLSVIAQLSSQGVAPDAFSHCLVGEGAGGGILVLGQIIEPNMVYTPLIPSQPHYNLNLLSISVNGQTLSIDPSMFATSGSRGGTIIDSGTTLAYLAEEAYVPFVDAITRSVSQSVQSVMSKGSQCYVVTSSTPDMFPTVSLNFAGGASMFLRPQDYLLQQNSVGGAVVWCIGFQKIRGQGITILGDLVLKDRIVVYDLGGQRIGWANYDYASPKNPSLLISESNVDRLLSLDVARHVLMLHARPL